MARVVVLGASLTDMNLRLPRLPVPGETLLGGSFFQGPGGKGANQAIAARRAGADVVFLTAFGDDDLSGLLVKHDRAEGLDLAHARIVAGMPSGVALIFVGDDGRNQIGVASGPNAHLDREFVDQLPAEVFRSGDVLLASVEVPFPAVSRALERASAAGMTTILNPAPADRSYLDPDILRHVDVITPNEEELRELTGGVRSGSHDILAAAQGLISMGVRSVVATLGDRGCLVISSGEAWSIAAASVEAVDTVGAGDAFNGALAVALAEGMPLPQAATIACAAGSLAVTRPGAQGALPSRAAIEDLKRVQAIRPVAL